MIKLSGENEKKEERAEGQKESGKSSFLSRKKVGKDTYLILILAGILLFIIAVPIKPSSDKKVETGRNGQQSGLELLQEGESSPKGEDVSEGEADSKEVLSSGIRKEQDESAEDYTTRIEKKLEEILSCMAGAGKVRAMVTVRTSEEEIVEKDTTSNRSINSETDSAGGNRNVNDMTSEETTVYLTDSEGNKVPYVVKKMEPDVEGVIIVAQGGGDAALCRNITEVIQALFGLEAHKIKVVRMENEKAE